MAKAKSKANTEAIPITDVAPPNESAPSPSSRSIIIPSRPLMHDPMMTAPTETTAESPKEPVQTPTPAVVDTPPAAMTMTHERIIVPPASSSLPKPAPVQPMTDVTPPPQPEVKSETELEPKASPTAVAEPMNLEAAAAQAEDAEDDRQKQIDELVTTQKYFLPVDGVELKKARYFVFLGVILIVGLAIAWADAALDAGLVTADNLPHTHFFTSSNNTSAPPTVAPTQAAFKSFTTPQAKVQFRYPNTWSSKDLSSDQTSDSFKVQPVHSEPTTSVSTQIIYYGNKVSPPSPSSESSHVTVIEVSYQPFAITKSTTAYLRDLVYKDAKGSIGVSSTVTSDKLVKIGDNLDNKTTDYQIAANPKKYSFGLDAKRTVNNVEGYSSQTAAQKELKNPTYQQGRKILLSIRLEQ